MRREIQGLREVFFRVSAIGRNRQQPAGEEADGGGAEGEQCRLAPRQVFRIGDDLAPLPLADQAGEVLDPIGCLIGVARDCSIFGPIERLSRAAHPSAMPETRSAVRCF